MPDLYIDYNDTAVTASFTYEDGLDGLIDRLNRSGYAYSIDKVLKLTSEDVVGKAQEDEYGIISLPIGTKKGEYWSIPGHFLGYPGNIKIMEGSEIYLSSLPPLDRIRSFFKDMGTLIKGDLIIGTGIDQLKLEEFHRYCNAYPSRTTLDKYSKGKLLEAKYYIASKLDEDSEELLSSLQSQIVSYLDASSFLKNQRRINKKSFEKTLSILKDLLKQSNIPEETWQNSIIDILKLIFPQYIFTTGLINLKEFDGHDRKPDFIMVDSRGYIDFIEIKKSDKQLLQKTPYRNNYVPSKEVTGGVIQLEIYIRTLCNMTKDELEKLQTKLYAKGLSEKIKLKVRSPQGYLIIGNSEEFNDDDDTIKQKKQDDFELIRRQHKEIVDIITYDDLIARFENIIESIKDNPEPNAVIEQVENNSPPIER